MDEPASFVVTLATTRYSCRHWQVSTATILCVRRIARAAQAARELLVLAEETEDRFQLMVGHRAVGMVMVHTGELIDAREHLERSLNLYDESQMMGNSPSYLVLIMRKQPQVSLAWHCGSLGIQTKLLRLRFGLKGMEKR